MTPAHDAVSAHLSMCHQCESRGRLCAEAERLLAALADETAKRIAPMPMTPGEA